MAKADPGIVLSQQVKSQIRGHTGPTFRSSKQLCQYNMALATHPAWIPTRMKVQNLLFPSVDLAGNPVLIHSQVLKLGSNDGKLADSTFGNLVFYYERSEKSCNSQVILPLGSSRLALTGANSRGTR